MNHIIKVLAASGILASSFTPVFAQTVVGDPMTTNCSDYATQDDAGKMSLAMQLNVYTAMTDEEKTAVEAMTTEQKAAMIVESQTARAAMSEADMAAATEAAKGTMDKIMTNCQATPEKTIVDAMDAAM
jgi:RNase H-fold protein (predicted Holliday junction resolvase)